MRQVQGYSLGLGHVGDLSNPQRLLTEGIVAVVDLASTVSPALRSEVRAACDALTI